MLNFSYFRARTFFMVALLAAGIISQSAATRGSQPTAANVEAASVDVPWHTYRNVQQEPMHLSDARWTIVCFLGAECPLARLYGPRLERLQREFATNGVRLVGVDSNPQDSPNDIRRYVAKHGLTFPIVKDTKQEIARQFQATRTPEVFILDASRRIRYRGRIDDQYEPGIQRKDPRRQELRDALTSLLAGGDAPVARTAPVGCRITFVNRPVRDVAPADAVTFTRDVAPILHRHCVECHRPGEIGPFSLIDYDEVIGWGEMMLEVIEQKRMPPWHADPHVGRYVGAHDFPKAAAKTLRDWVDQGMPQGASEDLPALPKWSEGWSSTTAPDYEFAIRERPFVVPAEGTVEYQYFVVDPQWETDQWIKAAQVVPGDASVVHHVIVFVRPPDGARTSRIASLGGYVPGQRTRPLPAGHARRVLAGSNLVFQMHYTPNGRKTEDVTRVGIWTMDASQVTHEVTTRVAVENDFEIPPGDNNYVVKVKLADFHRHARLLSISPHMHLRGKSFQLAVRGEEKTEPLLSVPRYDFNWQHRYELVEPLELAKVRSLDMQFAFDNSKNNPFNPDPGEFTWWGDQSWEEMAVAFFEVAHPIDKPRVKVNARKKRVKDEAKRTRQINDAASNFISRMDRNGDGVVDKEEVSDAFRKFGFRQFDANNDGRLEEQEVRNAAAGRF